MPVTVVQAEPVRVKEGEGEALEHADREGVTLGAPLGLAPPLLEAHWVSLRD